MKEIKFSYIQSRETVQRGIDLSGMYEITKGKKILFTALCAFIIVNSAYAMITTGKFSLIHLFYIVFGVAILGYTWLLPKFIVSKKLSGVNENLEVELSIKPSEIIETKGEKKTAVTARDFRGYLKGEKLFVAFGSTNYLAIPTESLSEEEEADIEEILKYFHNPDYFKSEEEKAADNEPEFETFVPPDDFIPEEPTTLENEDTENE